MVRPLYLDVNCSMVVSSGCRFSRRERNSSLFSTVMFSLLAVGDGEGAGGEGSGRWGAGELDG